MGPGELELIGRLAVAALVGAVIGFEREAHDRPAGIRTHALVALGAALFTLAGAYGFADAQRGNADPARVAAQVATGIGFVGAGAIMRSGMNIKGLTTAATLWLAAALGVMVAGGDILLAVAGAAILLLIVVGLRTIKFATRGVSGGPHQVVVHYEQGSETLEPLLDALQKRGIRIDGMRIDDGGRSDPSSRRTVTIDVEARAEDLAELCSVVAQRQEVASATFGAGEVHTD